MQPTAALFKSPGSLRRLALTTKQGPHNYYKGNRTGSMGSHTKYGGYIIDFKKVRTYVCPDLSMFRLTPFVPRVMEAKRGRHVDGEGYLRYWKGQGGKS